MTQSLLDQLPTWLLFIVTVALFAAASQLGTMLAQWRRRREAEGEKQTEDKKSYASVMLAALLALLGLLLAFSFSIVEGRFLERRQLVLQEANAIGTTYLRAEMLPSPHREIIQELVREYVELRAPETPEDVRSALAESERLHQSLWIGADAAAEAKPDPITGLFIQSLNEVIDLHQERVTVGIYQRLPSAILLTLYLVALLAMGIVGYSAGLSRVRPVVPTAVVIVAISVVLMLIVDLDRPFQRAFRVNQEALDDVQETISKDYASRQQQASLPPLPER